ncbi:MAG: hypothetical protein RL538_326 [Candidatus Parcubacteria bacterium]
MLFLVPLSSKAAVLVSEVAWMGSTASANHEWIELYNNGSAPVDIAGWTLSDGMNLQIPLTGTIPVGSYVVLERTSDDSVSGTAFLIYTGALVNTGATLTLTRADGGLEDQVAGGENWQSVGGDNVTKETAQYTTAGWVTGAPTPGAANSGVVKTDEEEEEVVDEEETKEESAPTKKSSGNSSETVRLILTDSVLALTIDAQKVGYVNQPITFEVQSSGVGKTIESSLVYQWNFGDGVVKFGKEPTYQFLYPGKYIVTVYGAFKRQEQLARHEITILPVAVSITRNDKGDVQINNDSPYEIDISGYRVRAEKSFTFPEYSIVLPNQTVTLARSKVGSGTVRVYDAGNVLVTTEGKVLSISEKSDEVALPYSSSLPLFEQAISNEVPLVLAPQALEDRLRGFIQTAEAATASSTRDTETAAPTNLTPVSASTSSRIPKNAWPYLGLIIIIILGLVGTASKMTRNQID